jgi:hypothetical protein
MIYILMLWTVVGVGAADKSANVIRLDWRPLGEFHAELLNSGFQNGKTARQMCEDAAKQLGLKAENYRCVRSK